MDADVRRSATIATQRAGRLEELAGKHFGGDFPDFRLSTELMAGVTTFMVMAYILFVNPSILTSPDVPDKLTVSAVTTATALVAGIMTIVMGLATNRAYAIAPGMGLNAIVAFQLMGAMGLTAAQAMGVIVAEGVVITVLVLLGIRKYVMTAIPVELKRAISVGIGLFILFIGLVKGGLVVADPATLVRMGDLRGVPVLVTVVALFLTVALLALNVRGALLWGIIGGTIFSIIAKSVTGTSQFAPGVAEVPTKWVAAPDFSRIGHFSFGFFSDLGVLTAVLVILAIMMADFFDTMGTLIGVGSQAGYLDEKGELPQAQRALLVDSLALADSNGTIQTSYTYDPFGNPTVTGATSSNTQQYTGRESDGTGLQYNRARYYSPTLQRFISEDPLGFGGGDVNLYAYAGNDPINASDPSGLQQSGLDPGTEGLASAVTGRQSHGRQWVNGRTDYAPVAGSPFDVGPLIDGAAAAGTVMGGAALLLLSGILNSDVGPANFSAPPTPNF